MATPTRTMAVTYALTYANGSLHLGHLVGFIQTDIWVRYQRMQGTHCIYISGCDAHGTPIMIQAEKMQLAPEVLVELFRTEHQKDLQNFHVDLDNYHSTHSNENKALTETIYNRHYAAGNIIKHTIKQAYDEQKQMFLPDRYVKGECPRCGAKDQYGDACEICGATYSPSELKNPYSTLSGKCPIEKESLHYFFDLEKFSDLLHNWTTNNHLQKEVTNKLDEWFQMGLKEWDISRDAPYFGFNIPNEPQKYFYCWLDAPIGYMASLQNLCERRPELSFDDYWESSSTIELYHFIGKDIMYFHTLFWPAVLKGAGYRLPTAVFCHGFLTIDGQKMSKSRGTFIKASTYFDHLNPEFLRYYFATKLSDRIEDLDLSFDDFMQRINADLIGKYINIASRSASFIHKYFNGTLSAAPTDLTLLKTVAAAGDEIAEKYERREFNQILRQVMALADRVNQYFDEKKPWAAIKEPANHADVLTVCTVTLNLFRLLTIYLKPILPGIALKVETFLKCPPLMWADKDHFLFDSTIGPFEPLALRVEKTQIEALKTAALSITGPPLSHEH